MPRLLPASLQSLLPLSLPALPHGPSFPLESKPCDYVDGPLISSSWTSACEVEASRKVSEDLKDKPVSWTLLKKKLERSTAFTIGSWPREKSKPINDCLLPGKGLGSRKMTGTLDTCKDPGLIPGAFCICSAFHLKRKGSLSVTPAVFQGFCHHPGVTATVLTAQSSAVISMDASVLLQDTKNRLVKMSKAMKQAGPETPRGVPATFTLQGELWSRAVRFHILHVSAERVFTWERTGIAWEQEVPEITEIRRWLIHKQITTLPAEKKGVLKGTPSTLSPRGKGAAVSSEMELPEEVGETTALAPSHLGIRQCEAQGGASRAHTEGPAMSSRKPGCAELKGWGVGSQRAVISPCVSKRPERRATGPSRTGADGIPSCARQPECNVSRSWDIHQTNRKGHG
ncbi:unnamed protein product [Rangifer tarandus platyrhynchus]|uniref:Uncharacterized protein n=2 Tax=Rangifer tarandus platyrhynchus TaxID=3082113 RepID=A0ABN8Y4S3_RANTA|nr:unnamed protein product [Rangifer tarandus platyrhynchus]